MVLQAEERLDLTQLGDPSSDEILAVHQMKLRQIEVLQPSFHVSMIDRSPDWFVGLIDLSRLSFDD